MSSAVSPLFYLPNIHYFSKLLAFESILLNDLEGFERQSYRNRCYIAGANGRLALIIPVQNRGNGQLTKHVKIDNSSGWQRIHWQSIRSAYGKAPYFEYYAGSLQPHFTRPCNYLFEFNYDLMHTLIKLMGIEVEIRLASSQPDAAQSVPGAEFIHPKKDYTQDTSFHPQRYIQTFEERLGFIPNLSIIDTLFNLGPGTVAYLRKCILRA